MAMFNAALRTRVEQLEKRVQELEDDLGEVRELPVHWEDWLHKIRNVLARLNRRAERDELESPLQRPATLNPAALALLRRQGE